LEPKVTSADVLAALHQATRLPIVADFYTRLYQPEDLAVDNRSLAAALDHTVRAMQLRWNREDEWLQFRSVSYYHNRLKEVPTRLLARWKAVRQQQGMLTLDAIIEIAQLSDEQLDGHHMAEGASQCWGLKEWRLPRDPVLRPHVRYLRMFTSAQRQEMMSGTGLSFLRMSLDQQRQFIALTLAGEPLQSLDDLAGAMLRVDYTQPGWYQWLAPDDFTARRWVIPLEPGPKGRRVLIPSVRERTPEAALRTARNVFPPTTDAMLEAHRRYGAGVTAALLLPQPEQIVPTELDLVIVYIPSTTNARPVRWVRMGQELADG
jgi:hypothetical protein